MSRCLFVLLFFVLAAPQLALAHESMAEVYARVSPAVVVVRAEGRAAPSLPGEQPLAFGRVGTGVLIDRSGRVLTAAHVVETADRVEVEFPGGEVVKATVYSVNALADAALLQLEAVPENAVVAGLGDSDAVRVGDPVFIIGAPYGVSHTLTMGVVSGRRQADRTVSAHLPELLQTDAAINQGNSGGPMFDSQGRVIGIVSYIMSQSGGSEGLGFAVAINSIRTFLLERRPFWSGLSVIQVNGAMARALNLPQPGGILVQQVARGSPGERAGLQEGTVPVLIGEHRMLLGGDIILAIDGIELGVEGSVDRVFDHLETVAPGSALRLTVLRAGGVIELSLRP